MTVGRKRMVRLTLPGRCTVLEHACQSAVQRQVPWCDIDVTFRNNNVKRAYTGPLCCLLGPLS